MTSDYKRKGAAELWRTVVRNTSRSRWGVPPFAPDFRGLPRESFRLVAGDRPLRFALLHRQDWWRRGWGGRIYVPAGAVSVEARQWPTRETAVAWRDRARALRIPTFFIAGLSPFDLALFFALRSQSPEFEDPHRIPWPLRLLTIDDRLLGVGLRHARNLPRLDRGSLRSFLPFENWCWRFLREVYGDELRTLLNQDAFTLLEQGRALDLESLQGLSRRGHWLDVFRRRAAQQTRDARSSPRQETVDQLSLRVEWQRVRSKVDEYYPEMAPASTWVIPKATTQIILCDKDAVARRVVEMKLSCGLVHVPYSRVSSGVCRALAMEAKRLGAHLLFMADLDPCALMLFANLCASDPEHPDARGRTMPIHWFGVDDEWLRLTERRNVTMALGPDELAELEFVERRCGSISSLVGPQSSALLKSGRKMEIEAISCLGLDRMESEIRRRLKFAPGGREWKSPESKARTTK